MWKTSTIITILVLALGVIAYVVYDKNQTLVSVEAGIEDETHRRVDSLNAIYVNAKDAELNFLKASNDSLKKKITDLENKLEVFKYGGEDAKLKSEIMNDSKKVVNKLKLRKGEFHRDTSSKISAYIKPDYYEGKVLSNVILKNKETIEVEWDIGKAYHYIDLLDSTLSEILVTYVDEEIVELEWTNYQ